MLFNVQVIGIAFALIYTGSLQLPTCSCIVLLPKATYACVCSKNNMPSTKGSAFLPQKMGFLPILSQGIQYRFCILYCMLAYYHSETSLVSLWYQLLVVPMLAQCREMQSYVIHHKQVKKKIIHQKILQIHAEVSILQFNTGV